MKKKKLKLPTLFLLLLPFFIASLVAGCQEEPDETPSLISGSWNVEQQYFQDQLNNISQPVNPAIYEDISIIIPDKTTGTIVGHTFINSIGFDFEIKEGELITLENYGGTRLAEDTYGASFYGNLMDLQNPNTLKYNISADELVFTDALGQTLIVFRRDTECGEEYTSDNISISGCWTVEKLFISGELRTPYPPPSSLLYLDISIQFPDNTKGAISGHTYANSFEVEFEITEKLNISFENYNSKSGNNEGEQGTAFVENLLHAERFGITGDKLYFFDAQGQIIMVFTRDG